MRVKGISPASAYFVPRIQYRQRFTGTSRVVYRIINIYFLYKLRNVSSTDHSNMYLIYNIIGNW